MNEKEILERRKDMKEIAKDTLTEDAKSPSPPPEESVLLFLKQLWGDHGILMEASNKHYRERILQTYGMLHDINKALINGESYLMEDAFFLNMLRVEVYITLMHNDTSYAGKEIWAERAVYHFKHVLLYCMAESSLFQFMHVVAEMAKICAMLKREDEKRACLQFLDSPNDISKLDVFKEGIIDRMALDAKEKKNDTK